MSEGKLKELRNDIDELNELLKQAKRKKVQDILSLEIRKLETEWIALKESENASATPMEVSPAPTTSAAGQNKRYQIKLNGYGWDQSDKYIQVFVTLKNVQTVPKEQVYCKLTDRSMELHVENLDNKDYLLVINNLLEPINVADSHWKQKTGKLCFLTKCPPSTHRMYWKDPELFRVCYNNNRVVIFLAKKHQNVKWSHMTEIEKKFEDQRNNRFKSSLNDDMDKKDPQESIMSLMKNMYETGDDEMKRMISKAWYEGQQKKKTDTLDF